MTTSSPTTSINISADKVAELCFDKFKNLPKTGKPNEKEWTILSGVVLHNIQNGKSEVVSLGCGTKCIGKSKLCPQGLILNDSHAEVLARRGLLRYIYHQLQKPEEESCIFEWVPKEQKFKLKDVFTWHFLSTQTPCGDACIIANNNMEELAEEPLIKRQKTEEVNNIDEVNVGCIVDSVYTGAKLIGSHHSDAMQQLVGVVRTKPGRGERTLSMSCSDKLAKWQIMGLQGALLDFLLVKPLYFESLNFRGTNDLEALERAIWKRFQHNNYENTKYKLHKPTIRICNEAKFPYVQDSAKQPSPNGLVWCDIPEIKKPYETSVNGKRQGITSKKLQSPAAALKISKFSLLKDFISVMQLKPELSCREQNMELKAYNDCKHLAQDYQISWAEVKLNYFKQWCKKPDNLLLFSVQEVESKDSNKK